MKTTRALPDGTRVLPWATWSEWIELKDMLTIGDIAQAKARVALYQIRRRGSVPISVLSSVALASQLKNPSPDQYSQRSSLSMTITRLVNGLTDRLQPRGDGASARSVHKLALELGLPPTLVDIRHQSCHNLLPRLSALESGAKQALLWLEQFYWKPQHSSLTYQLPRSFVDVMKVFENPERTRDGEALEPANVLLEGSDVESQNTNPVVHKMRQIANRLEDTQKRSVGRVAIVKKRSGGKRWRRCENSDAWKNLSLGLIPGQKKPPPLRKIDMCSGESFRTEQNPNDAPHDELVPSELRDGGKAYIPNEESYRPQVRNLTTEEVKKIASLTNHFESLVSEQSANSTICRL